MVDKVKIVASTALEDAHVAAMKTFELAWQHQDVDEMLSCVAALIEVYTRSRNDRGAFGFQNGHEEHDHE